MEEEDAPAEDEDDLDFNKVVKSRIIKVRLQFEGLNYKMRLRKEESVLKIIDVGVDFNDKLNYRIDGANLMETINSINSTSEVSLYIVIALIL